MKKRLLAGLLVSMTLLPTVGLADATSGPERSTLLEEKWGTVYYRPRTFSSIKRSKGVRGINLTLDGRSLRIERDLNSGLKVIQDMETTMEVEVSAAKTTFRMGKLEAQLTVDVHRLTLSVGEQKVMIERTSPQMRIVGSDGETRIVQDITGITITSEKGKTAFTSSGVIGESVQEGAPLQAHPHLGRGVFLETGGFGFFIDLWKYEPRIGVRGALEWDPVLSVPR